MVICVQWDFCLSHYHFLSLTVITVAKLQYASASLWLSFSKNGTDLIYSLKRFMPTFQYSLKTIKQTTYHNWFLLSTNVCNACCLTPSRTAAKGKARNISPYFEVDKTVVKYVSIKSSTNTLITTKIEMKCTWVFVLDKWGRYHAAPSNDHFD